MESNCFSGGGGQGPKTEGALGLVQREVTIR